MLHPKTFSRLLFSFAIAMTLSAPAVPQSAPAFSMAGGKTSSTLPFEMIDNRVFVDVRLNGRGPFHFIFDTGAGGFTMYRNVADQLGLHVEDAGEGSGVGARTSAVATATIAGVWMGQAGSHFAAVDVIAGGPAAKPA
jgi:predicted aspartyl protease